MSFDKYFNSIQDKASRYYRRLADLDDLIYDKYFNKFRGKTVFEAEVLSNPGEVPAEGSTANTDLFIPLRVRIKDIHDNRLPDPYDAVKGITDEVQKLNEFRKLILSHPVAYPDTKNLMQSAISQGLTQGSIVEVYFAEEGPDFNGRMRGLRYRQVIVAAPTRSIPNELSIASGFEGGETLAIADVQAMFFDKTAAINFINRLRSTSYFSEYSDEALAGIAANVNAESAFYFNAAGDARVSGSEERAIESTNGINGKQGKYCSFGFFQLNACGTGAEGMLIAKQQGFMDSSGKWTDGGQQKFIDWLTDLNGINQLVYVAKRLKDLGLDIKSNDANQFGYDMTVKFEKPQNKEVKGQERGSTAVKILEEYKKSKGE